MSDSLKSYMEDNPDAELPNATVPSGGRKQDMRPYYSKYYIFRRNADGSLGERIEGAAFTLRPHDPHARVAMLAYANSVRATNPQLADDLENMAKG